MNAFSIIASITTVLSFIAFAAILAWAYSRRNAERFAAAAAAPFALPDEAPERATCPAERSTT
jgi:cbb3-type cytochrome oxidase subunit 3